MEKKENLISPYEAVESKCSDMSISDSEVCFYLMELINNTIYSLKNGILKLEKLARSNDIEYVKVTSEDIITFEDYYYYTWSNIHRLYRG